MHLDRLALLKINGAGEAALAGATESLWRLRPFVIAHDGPSLRFLCETLGTFGYRCWQLDAHTLAAVPEEAAAPARLEALEEMR